MPLLRLLCLKQMHEAQVCFDLAFDADALRWPI